LQYTQNHYLVGIEVLDWPRDTCKASVAGFQTDVCFVFKKDVFCTSFIIKTMLKNVIEWKCPQLVCVRMPRGAKSLAPPTEKLADEAEPLQPAFSL
jgi:hypothetical protein